MRFFDINGIEIKRGDVVELVECFDPRGREKTRGGSNGMQVGDRIWFADRIEPSLAFKDATFISSRNLATVGHGKWKVVHWQAPPKPRDVRKAVVMIPPAPFGTPEWPWDAVPAAQTIPDHVWNAKLATTGRTRSDAPHICSRRSTDPTNPKDAIGSCKAPTTCVPATIQAEDGLAMLEGALKYGRHNYRAAPVRASVYLDALRRHLARWVEGEDIDPDSGLSHLIKARACLGIIRDAQICGTLIDDRPPSAPIGFFVELDKKAAALVAKYPDPVPPYVAGDPRIHGRPSEAAFAERHRDPVEVELDALKARTLPR